MTNSLAFVLACGLCLWLGWHLRDTRELIHLVWDDVRTKKQPEAVADKPKSMIVEPHDETPAERAKREQDELIASMNVPR